MSDKYQAVVNKAGDYDMITGIGTVPVGYKAVGEPGPKNSVMAYIEEVWTDMTPAQKKELQSR